jgi:hypothetical protein
VREIGGCTAGMFDRAAMTAMASAVNGYAGAQPTG